jgi:hypothetical protein
MRLGVVCAIFCAAFFGVLAINASRFAARLTAACLDRFASPAGYVRQPSGPDRRTIR